MIIPPLMMYQATPQRADTNKNKLHNAEEFSVYISILCVMYLFINLISIEMITFCYQFVNFSAHY